MWRCCGRSGTGSGSCGTAFEEPCCDSRPTVAWIPIPSRRRETPWPGATAAGFAAAAGFALVGVITAIGAPALGAAAATAYAAATALGTAALDPPTPDPDFATSVDLSSHQSASPKSILAQFFTAVSRIMDLLTPFNAIQGKVLGAQDAGDAAAIDKQRASLAQALALMDAHYAEMQNALPAAQQELEMLLTDPSFVNVLKTWEQPQTGTGILEAILKGVEGNKELAELAEKLLQTDAPGLIDRLRQVQPLDTLSAAVESSLLAARAEAAALA